MKIEGETKRVPQFRPSSFPPANALDDRPIPETSDGIKFDIELERNAR